MGTHRQTPSHPRNRGLTEVMSPAEPRLLAQHRAALASILLLLQTTRCHHPTSDQQVCVSVPIPRAPNGRSQPPLTASGLSLDGDTTQLPSYCIPGSAISPWAARLSHCSTEAPRNSPNPAHPASPRQAWRARKWPEAQTAKAGGLAGMSRLFSIWWGEVRCEPNLGGRFFVPTRTAHNLPPAPHHVARGHRAFWGQRLRLEIRLEHAYCILPSPSVTARALVSSSARRVT